jgi:hypothetical protein
MQIVQGYMGYEESGNSIVWQVAQRIIAAMIESKEG